VGVRKSDAVHHVALEKQVNDILQQFLDLARLETTIASYKMELQRIQTNLTRLRHRVHALEKASPWPLSKDWEIRIDEPTFEETGRVFFVNHKDKMTTFEVLPPPEPGEKQYVATSMPEYHSCMQQIVKLVENFNSITTKLERCSIIQNGGTDTIGIRQNLETHILDTVHIVCMTLGTARNRVMDSASKFELVVVDEAAQSTEPATLAALQLGSRHAVFVGDHNSYRQQFSMYQDAIQSTIEVFFNDWKRRDKKYTCSIYSIECIRSFRTFLDESFTAAIYWMLPML
jgi:senataxin